MTRQQSRPVDWLLARTKSWLAPVVESRRAAGDPPREPGKMFAIGRDLFGLVEWTDGRWLVMALERGLAR